MPKFFGTATCQRVDRPAPCPEQHRAAAGRGHKHPFWVLGRYSFFFCIIESPISCDILIIHIKSLEQSHVR